MPWFAKARQQHDWLAASDIGFVDTGYRAIDDILRMEFRSIDVRRPGAALE